MNADHRFDFDREGRRLPVGHWSDLLFQATWWQDQEQAIWRLDELSAVRCGRIYRFIARQEDGVAEHLAWEATRAPEPTAEAALDAYDRGLNALLETVSEAGWIQRAELMTALRRRMQGLPATEGACFCGYPVTLGWDHSTCHAGMEIA
ncbi:hypothetical protein [Streptomyces europaeiscabiei]|uniref:hypothetical protein n=1 Tax=Streptomyces europaeiscabiei TaxID=146819 RepID=UPI0038F6FA27